MSADPSEPSFPTASIGLASVDRDLRYTAINERFARISGAGATSLIGRLVADAFPAIEPIVRTVIASGQPVFQLPAQHRPDSDRYAVSCHPLLGMDGAVGGASIAIQDITPGKQQEAPGRHELVPFMRHLPGAAWIKDIEGRYVYANPQGERIFNRRIADLLGRTDADLFPPSIAEQFRANDAKAILSGLLETIEILPQADGPHYSIVKKFPVLDDRGNPAFVGGVAFDITEQRRAEEALRLTAHKLQLANEALLTSNDLLRATKEQLQVITDNMAAAVTRCTRDLRYEWVSRGYAAWLGRPQDEIAGRLIRDVVGSEGFENILPYMEQALAGERVEYSAHVNIAGVGKRWIHAVYVPTKASGGYVDGWIAVVTDITEQKRAEEQLRQTQRLESLGILAGGIAHDFNNLLVGILGNASLARDLFGAETRARDMLSDVITASEKAAGLTRQLLAYAGRESLVRRRVDLSAVVREISGLLQASIPKTVSLVFDLHVSIPAVVEGDSIQLQQVVMNLVINAAEAIPEHAPGAVTVAVTTRKLTVEEERRAVTPIEPAGASYVVLTVTDTGVGMAPDVQSRIFDPFFTTKFLGRGLGLSAVLGIVKAHKGTMTLDSTPGAGTVFSLLLPSAGADPNIQASQPALASRTGGGKVLVVDDESAVRTVAQRTLVNQGYEVLLAADGRESLEVIAANPDIIAIVLDLAMPVMSGEQALPLIRELTRTVPIVVSTGFSELEAVQRFSGVGAVLFLHKPYTAAQLLQKIAEALVA